MGRPKSFGEKVEHIMISCSKDDRKYLDEKGISPSKFFQDSLIKLRQGNNENSKDKEYEQDIEKVRAVYVKTERGLLPKEKYFLAIDIFMQKWTDVTKPEVMGRVERPRYYTDPKEDEKDEGVSSES